MVCIIPYMVWLRVNTGYSMFKQSFHKIIEVNDCRKLIGFSKSESLRAPSHINFAPGVKFSISHWVEKSWLHALVSPKDKKNILDKAFKNGASKFCGRQPFKNFEEIWSA